MWIASLETRHYDFDAFGTTEAEAKSALETGLREHGRQCGLEAKWFEEFDMNIREVELSQAYRDRSILKA